MDKVNGKDLSRQEIAAEVLELGEMLFDIAILLLGLSSI